jgi:multisubunit Na+/H+ antiporter MnhE subunit
MSEPNASGGGPPGGGRALGAALAWGGWWLLLLGLWLALSNSATGADVIAGATAAALGATASVLVRGHRRAVPRPRAAWLARLRLPLASIPGDCVRLAAALILVPDDELVELPFRPAGDDPPRTAARRVLAGAAGSLAPNTIVVDVDEARGVLTAHRLMASGDRRRAADPLELG